MPKSGFDPREFVAVVWWVPFIISVGVYTAFVYWPITLAVIAVGVFGGRWLILRARAKRETKVVELTTILSEMRRELGSDYPQFLDALEAVASGETPSMAMLQRRLGVTQSRARTLIGLLERYGIVTTPVGSGRRALTLDERLVVEAAGRVRAVS